MFAVGATIRQLEIVKQLGQGGMGAVYLARHRVTGAWKVVKTILPHLANSPQMVARFVNEARAASMIDHKNIIHVEDCDQTPDGVCYMVMPFLDGGGSLEDFLVANGRMSPRAMLEMLAQICDGLEKLHERGVVHRDIKAENIHLRAKGEKLYEPVLLDFGVAKLDESVASRTGAVDVMGTPSYMAPEQIGAARTVDRRADVYALAVLAYRMLTGGFPYAPHAYDSLVGLYDHQMKGAVDPRHYVPEIPAGIALALVTALSFDPAQRPRGAREFALLLGRELPAEDDFAPSGMDIVERVAPLLLRQNSLPGTVKTPKAKVEGRYRRGKLIGSGGMAEVYLATRVGVEGWEKTVAIKRILVEQSVRPDYVEMFRAEATIVAALNHPNIVAVFDFDRDEENQLFLAMEFVDGKDLRALAATGPVPASLVIYMAMQIASGLGYAHELPSGNAVRGVVHRDMSPHNVLLSWSGDVKVSDFGIAKVRTHTQVTGTGHARGKVAYMAPEQGKGEAIDGRADLFALGVIMWELLTGERLFAAESDHATIARVMSRTIPPPSATAAVPPDLQAIVMRLLERDRDARFPRAADVIAALVACADAPRDGRGDLARLLGVRFAAEVAARTAPAASDAPPPGAPTATAPTINERRSAQPAGVVGPASAPRHTPPMLGASPVAWANAANQSSLSLGSHEIAPTPKRSRSRAWIGAVAAAVGFGGALAVGLFARGGGSDATTRPAGAGSREAPATTNSAVPPPSAPTPAPAVSPAAPSEQPPIDRRVPAPNENASVPPQPPTSAATVTGRPLPASKGSSSPTSHARHVSAAQPPIRSVPASTASQPAVVPTAPQQPRPKARPRINPDTEDVIGD
ncbi:MAG TPA: protein kinase [Kofleriaceae bacterium]|jgi:serine/threonine-protein kinase